MTIENIKEKPVKKEELKTRVVVRDEGFGLITYRRVEPNQSLLPGEHPQGLGVGLDVPDSRRR